MKKIVALFVFGLIWSGRVNAQMDGFFSPDSLTCSNENGFIECMQGFTDSFFRSGIWEKAQTLMNSQSSSVSVPSFTPQEFEQLCDIYSSTDQCLNKNEIRQACGKNVAVKAIDNVFGFMCKPENKKVFIQELPCVQNLTANDPRMQKCNNNLMEQFGIERQGILGSGKPSIASLSNAMGNICNILKSGSQCAEPIIVENCGAKIFNLSVTLAENALQILNLDCDASGPITNSTNSEKSGIFGGLEEISGSNGPMGEILSHLNLFCDANNDGLQECSLIFAQIFSSPEWESTFQKVFDAGSEDSFANVNGKLDLQKLNEFCNVTYDSLAGCMTKQKLVEVCPKASLVKLYHGIFGPMCSPGSKQKFVAALECKALLTKKSNSTTTGNGCSPPGSFGSRIKRQVDSIFLDSQTNSGSGNPFAGICDDMKNFIQCEKSAIIRECGQETFDVLLQLSQGAVSVFDESCNVTEPGGKMMVNPFAEPNPSGSCPPSKCAQRFNEASSGRNRPLADIFNPGHFPGLTTEEYLQRCETADALRKCLDETEGWTGCENDESFKTIKNTLLVMCPASNRDAVATGIDCLNDLNNRNPDFRRCVMQFENATNTAPLCSATTDAYKCAKGPIVDQCGSKVFMMMVNITGSTIEATVPGCSFASNFEASPEVGKKPPSAVGELRGEVSEKSKENSATSAVSSLFALAIAAILAFW